MSVRFDDFVFYNADITYDGVHALFARPSGDLVTNSWTPTPLFSKIDEVDPDDSDKIVSPLATGFACEVSLNPIFRPSTQEDHVLYYRIKRSGGLADINNLTVELYQEQKLIASRYFSGFDTNFSSSAIYLDTGEAGFISDYSKLSLRFITSKMTTTYSGLRSHWRFDRSSGDAYGKNPIMSFSSPVWTGAKFISGAYLNNSDMVTSGFNVSGSISFAGWVNVQVTGRDQSLVTKIGQGLTNLALMITGGYFSATGFTSTSFGDFGVSYQVPMTGSINYFLGTSYNPFTSALLLRVNQDTRVISVSGAFNDSYSGLFFGAFRKISGVAFDGWSAWDRALTSGEFDELYNNGSGRIFPF
jgi:hypothetical protein